MTNSRPVLVAAGGTGGHLFPAEALSNALAMRGMNVELVTDSRAQKYGGAFPARAIHEIRAATPSGGSLLQRVRAGLVLFAGFIEAYRLLKRIKPLAIVGFGGYPTVPPVLAASWLHVPVVLHEANAIIGRANQFLAPRANAIATGFPSLGGLDAKTSAKTHLTGNPVRPMVLKAAAFPFPSLSDGKLRLLVTGGSQGARIMSDIVPAAVELMPGDIRDTLEIVQQARPEDLLRVREAYDRLGVKAEVMAFFPDLPLRIAEAHLVIGRAGASTVSELAVIGRPAILVPLPHSLDQDQAENARQFVASGAGIMIMQSEFSPQWLAGALCDARADLDGLARRAELAKKAGISDAAERLADLVLKLAGKAEKAQ